jgi:integrase/recombinase XerC
MVCHLAFHGLRVSEVRNVKHKHIDLDSELKSIFILGKRKRRRYVPVSDSLVQHIREFIVWKTSVGLSVEPDSFLIQSPRNPNLPYSISGLEAMYVRALREAGIARKTFHSARHSFGFRVYDSTSDLRATQQLLGHANMQTVECYTFCTFDKLAGYVNEMAKK